MIKSIEAILRGYYKFEVNDKVFYLYHRALAHRKHISKLNVNMWFIGHHVIKGERMFYCYFSNKQNIMAEVLNEN